MMQPLSKRKVTTSRATIMRELPSSFVISDADVLCAKGKKAKEHPGNRILTALVHSHLNEYASAVSRLEKSFVVSKIMKHVKNAGGRFVRIVKGAHFDIGGRNAREKVGQALRDLLHEQYRSSTRAKACIRRSRAEASGSSRPSNIDITNNSNKGEPTPSMSTSGVPNLIWPNNTTRLTPEATPDEPISLSCFDGLQACLEPEDDFLFDNVDIEPLPVAQSLVEEVDFDQMSPAVLTSAPKPIELGETMQDMLKRHFSRRTSFAASCRSSSDSAAVFMSNFEHYRRQNDIALSQLHFNISNI